MAGYTKADYDLNYDIGAEGEWGHSYERAEVRLHYVRSINEQFFMPRWDAVVPHLRLGATHRVVVAGSGFGWGLDYLKVLVPGITAIGVDISDYVESAKGSDETLEIDAAIRVVGLDPLTGRGLQIHNKYFRPGDRTKSTVLKEDMESARSRDAVVITLGREPTHVISEDMIQELSDAELIKWSDEVGNFTSTEVVHVISSERLRTARDINRRTGHRVLVVASGEIQADVK